MMSALQSTFRCGIPFRKHRRRDTGDGFTAQGVGHDPGFRNVRPYAEGSLYAGSQVILGHPDIRTTQRYQHVRLEDQETLQRK